jgi:hypothetical protein
MSIISKPNPDPVNTNYSQPVETNIFIRFMMQDSASASGQDATGMPLPGKQIFANYSFQSHIVNTQGTTAPQILIGGATQIFPATVYTESQAMQLWNTYVAPNSHRATIDLNTRVITIPYP